MLPAQQLKYLLRMRTSLFKLIATPKQVKSCYSMRQASSGYKATHFYNFMSHPKFNFQITFSLCKHMSMPRAHSLSFLLPVYIKLALKCPFCLIGYRRQLDTSLIYLSSYQILFYSFPHLLLNLISF